MFNILLRCPHCGKIYRVELTKNGYRTDFNDDFKVKGDKVKCFSCNKSFQVQPNKIVSYSWILDLFFKVKGN